MVINQNFMDKLAEAGITMYALSKRSGVPYTTVNEICNGKNDINQCAAGTVHRLAAALGTTTDSIINPINYLDGIKGKYKGIEYTWSTDGNSFITFEHNDKQVTLDAGTHLNMPSRMNYYEIIAGWMIKDYTEKADWQKSMQEKMDEIRKKRQL